MFDAVSKRNLLDLRILDNPRQELSHDRLSYLDGWRGVAILSVLLHHFLALHYVNLGTFGVDVFFVLSGLLISQILFDKQTNFFRFMKRRFSRTFPMFFIYLTTICALSYIFSLSDEHFNYFYSVTFTRAYLPAMEDPWTTGLPVGHLWSLYVEEHSYIFLAFLSLLPFLKGKEYIVIIGVGLAGIFFRFFHEIGFIQSAGNYEIQTHTAASHVMLSAGYYLFKKRFNISVHPVLPLVAFFLAMMCFAPISPPGSSWAFSPILLAFSANHIGESYGKVKEFLSLPILTNLGLWSYSIYLWQQPLYYYGVKFDIAFPYAGPILFCVSIIIGYFSFRYIESPVRDYLNARWK